MKTDLTRKIEDKLKRWKPSMLSNIEIAYQRCQYSEFEVPVKHGSVKDGIVDFVWCIEGFTNKKEIYISVIIDIVLKTNIQCLKIILVSLITMKN